MNVLLTGGLGVIGAWVARHLLQKGHRPVIYDSNRDLQLVADIKEDVKLVTGDILDFPALVYALKEHKISHIVHLAALMPEQCQADPYKGFMINAQGPANVLEAARILAVEKVVYASSKAVMGNITGEYGHPAYKPINEDYSRGPENVYGITKLAGEILGLNYKEVYGLDFVALRFGVTYGPGKTLKHGRFANYNYFIENAMAGRATKVASGMDIINDLVYVKDIANGVVLACFTKDIKHSVLNIGSGRGYSLMDMINAVKTIYPDASFELGAEPGLEFERMMPTACVFDISRAKEALGYQPQFTLEQGVKDFVETIKSLEKGRR